MCKWKCSMWVPINSGNRSRELLREFWFRIAQVVRHHSENGILHSENYFLNTNSCSRIPRNAPRALRVAFSLRERFSWNWGGPQASELLKWLEHMNRGISEKSLCVLTRDYLYGTSIFHDMGFGVPQGEEIGCDTPCPGMRTCVVRRPQQQEGYLSDTRVIPHEGREMRY